MRALPDCLGLGAFPTPLGCPCRAGDGCAGGAGVSPSVSKLRVARVRGRAIRRGTCMLVGGGAGAGDGAAPGPPGSARNPDFGVKFGKGGTGRELYVVRRLSDGVDFLERLDHDSQQQLPVVSRFTGFGDDNPMVGRLRDQMGMIHPIPVPPVRGSPAGLFVLFFFLGAMFDKLWTSASVSWTNRAEQEARARGRAGVLLPQVPMGFSMFLDEKDLQRKESVEWVNMVVGKLWKVYREGIENWIVGLLQPVIDDLEKPDYVERVEIKQFHLGEEPLSVRNVERRTSRQANDLQYQIGLRYTGDARALLSLKLKFGIIPIVVPVGIRDFDIDGELWVKLRLIPSEPWVGAVSWAFVSLPKIKFELSPFRLFNIMAIPVLSMFLVKLLTEDLPLLFVRPKKIVLDFQKGQALYPVANDFLTKAVQEGNKDFVGELSVTLVDAKELFYVFFAKTDPYIILSLGDQTIRSKKNSQTTVIGPPGQPIWNQDFHLLVSNHKKQRLSIKVRDSLGFTDITIGTGEVDLQFLEDTVPTDRIVTLWGAWGLFGRGPTGKVLLRLTYKAYVEDDEDESRKMELVDGEISDDEMPEFGLNNTLYESRQNKSDQPTNGSKFFMDVLTDLLLSEQFQGIVASETGTMGGSEGSRNQRASLSRPYRPDLDFSLVDSQKIPQESLLLLCIAVITSIAVIICINISSSSFLSP